MHLKLFISFWIIAHSLNLNAQISKQTDQHGHDHTTDHHEHHRNEIGIANSPVYFIKEKVFSYGLHIHYVYNIPKTKFGVGVGYERIFDEHKHNTFGILGMYRPIDKLILIVSPGLTFEDKNSNPNFALHLETSYEFEIKNFHIGPVFEFAYDPEDYHLSLGLHIGLGF
ncbi:MAG: hypothetical protein M3Q56_04090 [Bacteroidota bacterium]|nr:hypothetical protein [Bacteroidota bacterium]